MRILYIHQFFATRESSLGLIRSYESARRMTAKGHEVVMITSSSRLPKEYSRRTFVRGDIDGIDVRAVRVGYSNHMGYARRIASFLAFMIGATWLALRAPRPDIVFATSTPLTVGIPGAIAAWLRRVPLVFEVRDLWPEAAIQMGALRRESLAGRAAKILERWLYRRSALVIALSPGMAEGVVAEGVGEDRVLVVPNGADLDLFAPREKDPGTVRQFGLAGRFVVGYAGAIGPSNAVEDSVPGAATALLKRGRTDIVFLIAGDGRCLPGLRDTIEREGLDNVVLAGDMPKRDVPRITATADVLMTLFADKPILATNSPNKFFDGLASGRPMIVNSPGWTRDLVEANDCGLYVPAGDPAALADAIESLADDDDMRARMGANARKLAETGFGRDMLTDRLLGALEEAARSDRRDPEASR